MQRTPSLLVLQETALLMGEAVRVTVIIAATAREAAGTTTLTPLELVLVLVLILAVQQMGCQPLLSHWNNEAAATRAPKQLWQLWRRLQQAREATVTLMLLFPLLLCPQPQQAYQGHPLLQC